MTLNVIQGHWYWCHLIGHIWFPFSLPLYNYISIIPFPRSLCSVKFKEVTCPWTHPFGGKLTYITQIFVMLAAWRIYSGNGVGRINEVTLRRARLVLGWVMCPGSTPGGDTLFRYVTSHPKPTQPFILSGSINWVVSNFIGCVPVASSGECSRG